MRALQGMRSQVKPPPIRVVTQGDTQYKLGQLDLEREFTLRTQWILVTR